MGQQTSFNCKNTSKERQQEIQTTHSNAIDIARTYKPPIQPFGSQMKSRKATPVQSQITAPTLIKTTSTNQKKAPSTLIAQHQNLLRVGYSQFQGAEKVGSRWVQRGGKSLAQIIEGRYNSTMHFPQPQIVALIESLIYSLAYLEKYEFVHHDYYPTNIFYCGGIFKLVNPINIDVSSYALTQQRRRFSFLSPELIMDILDDTPEQEISPQIKFKADIFAIGMILLQFCTLQPSADCYDEQNYSLVDKKIKQRLVKVGKLYSPTIADCITEMLVYNVEQRLGVLDLAMGVFQHSPAEKVLKQQPANIDVRSQPGQQGQQQALPGQAGAPAGGLPQKQYQANPQHLQPQYVVLPGQAPPQVQAGQVIPLSPNNVGLPTPNYAYSHIGPNNQGLLSPSTLQNKLRVIEQIHEKPQEEEESDGMLSSMASNVQPTISDVQEGRQAHYAQNGQILQQSQQAQGTRHPQNYPPPPQNFPPPPQNFPPPPQNYPPQQGYPQGYPPHQGYSPQQAYPVPKGYPYPVPPGYPQEQQDYQPQQVFHPQQGYPPQQVYQTQNVQQQVQHIQAGQMQPNKLQPLRQPTKMQQQPMQQLQPLYPQVQEVQSLLVNQQLQQVPQMSNIGSAQTKPPVLVQNKPFSPPMPAPQIKVVNEQFMERQQQRFSPSQPSPVQQFKKKSNTHEYNLPDLPSAYQQKKYPFDPPSYSPKKQSIGSTDQASLDRQKPYNASYRPAYKQSNYTSQSTYENDIKPSPRTLQYGLQTKYEGSYKPSGSTANKYSLQSNTQTSKYVKQYYSPSIGNKYARATDENGETLQQRVDRILQISRNIK